MLVPSRWLYEMSAFLNELVYDDDLAFTTNDSQNDHDLASQRDIDRVTSGHGSSAHKDNPYRMLKSNSFFPYIYDNFDITIC